MVNTDENGTPFLAGQISGGGARSNLHRRCSHPGEQLCQRLGIPPTTDVANRRWRLSAVDRGIAAAQVDAYMWLGRPWMVNAGPFSLRYALTLGANGLYFRTATKVDGDHPRSRGMSKTSARPVVGLKVT